MFLDEAYCNVLKALPPEKKKVKKQRRRKKTQERPEIVAITGLTAYTMSILMESAEMFNAAMANVMLEVADIFERQQNKLEESVSLINDCTKQEGMIQ